MKLSKNFSLSEFTRSARATRLGIANEPTPKHLANIQTLVDQVAQPLRTWYKAPIRSSSGYRSKELNRLTPNASKTSQHSLGEAVDLVCQHNNRIFHHIKDKLEFDQLIWEHGNSVNPQWVHVSYREGRNRKQVLRAFKEGGVTKYVNF